MLNIVKVYAYVKEDSFEEENTKINNSVTSYLNNYFTTLSVGETVIKEFPSEHRLLFEELIISVVSSHPISIREAFIEVNPVRLLDYEPERNMLEGQDVSAFSLWELPNKHLHGLWQSIVTDNLVKDQLLGYCDTSIRFAQAEIDANIISWNRMAICYGPPGTGIKKNFYF